MVCGAAKLLDLFPQAFDRRLFTLALGVAFAGRSSPLVLSHNMRASTRPRAHRNNQDPRDTRAIGKNAPHGLRDQVNAFGSSHPFRGIPAAC